MSNGTQAPARRGLPVWAWVGIGCGTLLVLVMVVVTIFGFFLARKVQDVAADFEKDPAMATARMIVRLNPELEEVAVDEEAGTITVRNTTTGEIITANFQDIEQGKISFKSGDKEISVDASEARESGTITITDGEDNLSFSAGETSSGDLPDWVPLYPGAAIGGHHATTTATTMSGGFELETTDPVDTVLEFYRAGLEEAGYAVTVNTYSQDGTRGGMVNGSHEGGQRTVVAILSAEGGGPTKVVVTYSQGS